MTRDHSSVACCQRLKVRPRSGQYATALCLNDRVLVKRIQPRSAAISNHHHNTDPQIVDRRKLAVGGRAFGKSAAGATLDSILSPCQETNHSLRCNAWTDGTG